VLVSWFYQSSPLFSFVFHSFLAYRVGDDLRYTHYGFSARLRYTCIVTNTKANFNICITKYTVYSIWSFFAHYSTFWLFFRCNVLLFTKWALKPLNSHHAFSQCIVFNFLWVDEKWFFYTIVFYLISDLQALVENNKFPFKGLVYTRYPFNWFFVLFFFLHLKIYIINMI